MDEVELRMRIRAFASSTQPGLLVIGMRWSTCSRSSVALLQILGTV